MFDQSHGLRFDIYERIHLSEELPGIAELEEVELIPEIQVIQREDRAELYGQLLLTGLYRGENDRTERLEHAIPVEITVPLTRVSSLEDIGVEIENFDIDLLTMRTVNITGVLSLRGIGGAETQPAWQQEEYTAAYSPDEEKQATGVRVEAKEHENDALYENSVWTYGEGTAENFAEEHEFAHSGPEAAVNPLFLEGTVFTHQPAASPPAQQKDKEVKVRTHSFDSPQGISAAGTANSEPVSGHFFGAQGRAEQAVPAAGNQAGYTNPFNSSDIAKVSGTESSGSAKDISDAAAENTAAEAHASHQEEEEFSAENGDYAALFAQDSSVSHADQENAGEGVSSKEAAPLQEEKPDLKVALGSKREEDIPTKEHLTFSSLLSSSRSRKEQEELIAEDTAAAAPVPDSGRDGEWKSRFIGGLNGKDLFRKVRLCIVQREETIDTIAEKYQLSARELVMYNRLSGQNVEEGQVLYIP
ncbi:LysM peptidoglycan-binding domain-containing protein [Paenibacillus sp. FSL L8-0436]|uniref:LysM peptidoglycan-binding domain-containing protein n=1 Tax=Paenibacillus sp. FSL L8-0436 TaxID=2954686 RepID=UPI0031582AA3